MKYNMRQVHKLKGGTHLENATSIGISRTFYTRLLKGLDRPSLPVARRIAKHFGVSLDGLIFPGEVSNSNNKGDDNVTDELSK